jgi:hypothetical protein
MRWGTLLAATASGLLALGIQGFGQQVVTSGSVTYHDVELLKEYPTSAYIKHSTGRAFIQKRDLDEDESRRLGITNPVAAANLESPSSSDRQLEREKAHVPPLSPKVPTAPSTGPPRSIPKPNVQSASSSKQISLPEQPYLRPLHNSSERFTLFEKGFLPLTEAEARTLFKGETLSPMASPAAQDAFLAAKVMLGELGSEFLPQKYRETLRGSAPRVASASAATARRSTSAPHDSSTFAAPNAISAAPATPRFVNRYDSAGNFHTGVVQPTGFYNGTVHSPMGSVGHVNGHVSPTGSFHGTDNHGRVYHGH